MITNMRMTINFEYDESDYNIEEGEAALESISSNDKEGDEFFITDSTVVTLIGHVLIL